MELAINRPTNVFESDTPENYRFVTQHQQPQAEDDVIYFPDERPLYTSSLLTTFSVGLALVFVALLVITYVTRNADYFEPAFAFTNIPLFIFSGLLVATIVIAFIGRKRYTSTKRYLRASSELKNEYREGLYLTSDGLIVRQANRVDAIPYDHIDMVKRLEKKNLFTKNNYLPEIHYRNSNGVAAHLNVSSYFVGSYGRNIWQALRERGVKIVDE